MSGGHDDETRQIPPPSANDATMLTPAAPASGSGVSRPISSSLASGRSATPSAPGIRRIGDYDLESEIARGGMGVVYKARQLSLNRPVAFKMILSGQFASAADVERFHVEAEAAAGLDHPNIVPIYEVGAFEGSHFFTMKLIDGHSLAAEMPRLQKAPREAVRLLVKVCRAIHYAHQHSILHRDLKPANILLDRQGEPHVTDFGLAKRTGGDSQLTQTGAIVGTPSYMAPEQAAPSKTPLTTAADVYSLGAILYEFLTGRPPFKGDSPLDTLMLVINKEAERPRSINHSADRDLETIALKCLEKDPERRYGSAEALAEDLDRWLNGRPILARPIGSAERIVKWAKRRPAIAALAVAIAAITLAGIAGVVWQWRVAVAERARTAEALIQVAQEAKAAEAARDREAAQRAAAEAAKNQEAIARQAADEQKAVAVSALDAAERSAYFNNISLADHEWAANNIGHVDQLLASAPPRLRGWEWSYLNRLAHEEVASIARATSSATIVALATSADGTRAMAVSSDLKVTLVDLQAHRVLRTTALAGRPGLEFSKTAIAADGSRFAAVTIQVASESNAGNISQETLVWDTTTGAQTLLQTEQALSLTAHSAIALSADGTRLVTARLDTGAPTSGGSPVGAAALEFLARSLPSIRTRLQSWDAQTGAELSALELVPGRVSSLSFSRDGRLIAASASETTGDPEMQVLDAATGKLIAPLDHSGDARGVFSPDGRRIGRGSAAGVAVWATTGGAAQWSWKGDATSVVAFSPSGRYIAAALTDRSIQVFEAASGALRAHLVGNTATVSGLYFGRTDADLIAADADHVRLFSIADPAPPLIGAGDADGIATLGVSPDGARLVALVRGVLRAWDLASGQVLYGPAPTASGPSTALPPAALSALAFSSGQLTSVSGRLSFSADGVRTVLLKSVPVTIGGRAVPRTGMRVLDTRTGKEVIAFNPAGERTNGPGNAAPSTAPVRVSAPAPVGVATSLAIDGTGQRTALTTLNVRVSMAASTAASAQAPSGMAFAGSDVVIWTAPHEQPTLSLSFSDRFATGAEFSPDGRYLALITAAYSDKQQAGAEYRIYDATTGRLAVAFPGDRQSAPIAFSRDGRLVAAETARHTVTIWSMDRPGRPVVLAEQRTPVTRIAFSPDATRIATLSDQGVTLFDTVGGQQLLGLREAAGPFSTREVLLPGKAAAVVNTLEFSADGRQIILMTIASDPKGIKVTFKTWAGGQPD